jgi:hypothetical protein
MGDDNPGGQNQEPKRTLDFRPVCRNKGEERGRDQKTADDRHHHGDVDPGRKWRKHAADAADDRGRNHAIGLPPRKISLKALTIGPLKHCRGSSDGHAEGC